MGIFSHIFAGAGAGGFKAYGEVLDERSKLKAEEGLLSKKEESSIRVAKETQKLSDASQEGLLSKKFEYEGSGLVDPATNKELTNKELSERGNMEGLVSKKEFETKFDKEAKAPDASEIALREAQAEQARAQAEYLRTGKGRGGSGKFIGGNGNIWMMDAEGKPYDTGIAAKGEKDTVKINDDGTVTVYDPQTGQVKKVGGEMTDDPLYEKATEMAEKWANDQAGLLSSDKSDFATFGGNRNQAIVDKTAEFYAKLKGTSPGPASTVGSPPDTATQDVKKSAVDQIIAKVATAPKVEQAASSADTTASPAGETAAKTEPPPAEVPPRKMTRDEEALNAYKKAIAKGGKMTWAAFKKWWEDTQARPRTGF